MARYIDEFVGISAGFRAPSGADPNYRDGYAGMRMIGGRGRAAYGAHRLSREEDLGTAGRFGGLLVSGRGGIRPHSDPRWEESGGIGASYRDPRLLHDFNAHSPAYLDDDQRSRSGHGLERGRRYVRAPGWSPRRAYHPRYTNRGVTDAGYSEGWARGSMPGAR
jgi:hypothetical protein